MAIQRYNIYGGIDDLTQVVPASKGTWVRYTDLEWYRRNYITSLVVNVAVIVICAVLSAYLVTGKYAPEPTPVLVPMGAGEKAELLKELTTARKEREDVKNLAANYKAQIKILTAAIDQDGQKLAALQERGKELDRINKDARLKMTTAQETIVAAKQILGPLGVTRIQVVER